MPPRERERLLMSPPILLQGQQQEWQARSFWRAIQERRECSDQEAARNAAVLARRSRNKYVAIAFGQVVALVAASVNMTSFTLENDFEVVAPTFQLFAMYSILTIHLYFRSQSYRPSEGVYLMPLLRFRIRVPWYFYFLNACIDVGAGIIMLISLQYTSLTSVTLLASLTVPSTMIFSKFLLGKSFFCHHILGVFLCLVGGCLTIWSDRDEQGSVDGAGSTYTPRLLTFNIGDLLALTAALLYGLGDAVSEYSIKHIDRTEYLGTLGLFGMVLTGLQFPFQERDVLSTLFSDPSANRAALLLMGSYVSLLILYYVTEASFLLSSDATLLNLSLQAQNLWAILFTVLAQKTVPSPVFYLALVLVVIGVFVYEAGQSSDPVMQLVQNGPAQASLQMEEEVAAEALDTQQVQGGSQYDAIPQIEII